jgi:light-harvesting complex I chlorophyll a/b binding protein 4
MAALCAQTSLTKTVFLGSVASKLGKTVSVTVAAPTRRSLKVEAKGNWLPGSTSPAWLDGSLPGDNGFDPLALGENPENLKWYVQAELQNGRWAMLGVAGIIIPEALTKAGLLNVPVWFEAGAAPTTIPFNTLLAIEFLLFNYVELRRWQDIKNPGSTYEDPIFKGNKLPAGDVGYPGGIFNPLGFSPDFRAKESELANGRLAMTAFFAFIVQSHITNAGPFDNLLTHLSDPWHNTVFQSLDAFFTARG